MERKIEAFIRENDRPMTAIDLIGAMDESAEEISAALMRMTRDGRLVYTKKGK